MFKVGDKVVYKGGYSHQIPAMIGRTGTVIGTPRPESIVVHWGDRQSPHYPENLALAKNYYLKKYRDAI